MKFRLWGTLLCLIGLSGILFTNCSRVSNTQGKASSKLSGGGAYDGKVYYFDHYEAEKCSDNDELGLPKPNGTIEVSPAESGDPQLHLTRQNCSDLAKPLSVKISEVRIDPSGSLDYRGTTFQAKTQNTFAPIGYSMLSPEFQNVWGGGKCIIDALWNANIGDGNRVVSQRFRALHSGNIGAIRTYFNSGQGTGGIIRIRIYPDDGTPKHRPDTTAAPLAEAIYNPGLINGQFQSDVSRFTERPLTSFAPLVRGELYHVHYENIHPDSARNWLVVESATTGPAHGRPCHYLAPEDWAVLRTENGQLEDHTQELRVPAYFAPILEIRMAQGEVFGNSNRGTGIFDTNNYRIAMGSPVRERITPLFGRSIARMKVHAASSIAGQLQWAIKDGSTVLASGTISETTANYKVGFLTAVDNQGFFNWYNLELPQPLTLQPGRAYDIEFSALGGSEWVMASHGNAQQYGFDPLVAFTESRAEHLVNGNWIGADPTSKTNDAVGVHWRLMFESR